MKLTLNDNWKLSYIDEVKADYQEQELLNMKASDWMDIDVPGDVHSTLLKHGKIEDPFYSTNVEKCRWIEDKVWIYKKEFNFDKLLESNEVVELAFNGLDTFATIYLNDEKLGNHENMFTPACFDITSKLKHGINSILVKFNSPIKATADKDYSRMWYSYNTNRVWARKAQMNYRWDWGPRIITVGIWKDVELNIYNTAKLESVFVRTLEIKPDEADLLVEIESKDFSCNKLYKAEINLSHGIERISNVIEFKESTATLRLRVNNPKLWWTHDLGTPELYDLQVNMICENKVIDSYSAKIGIRTVEVRQKDDRGNNRFIFVLNGIETFSKGANWIPAHNFIGAINDETYIKWIEMAKDCNMNMLRVWGGGIYEKDIFYKECDRQGILVWQDFMFTCSSYPDFDKDFMNNVREEVIHVVKSLRNYTSIAIWCGNNEIQWIHGQKMPDLKDMRMYGEKIYHDLMPELLQSLDPSRLFWPSSPFGGNDPNSDDEGDKHNWQVWAGQVYPHKNGERMQSDNTPYGISFKRFAEDMGKFISEFGMHALPVKETLKDCIPEGELYFGSFEMRYRNKDKRPNRGKLLMEGYTGLPANLDQYIDFSMMAQAEGLKYGIEHFRRRKPECSGTLIWQINDCWPTMSWSIVDFYYRPKAGFYYTKRVYKPILISFKEEGPDNISLWITNDTLGEYRDNLVLGLKDFFGFDEYLERLPVTVPANTSMKIKEFSRNRINVTYSNFEFLYVVPYNKEVDTNIFFFEDYKDLNLPPCELIVNKSYISNNKMEIRISTDNFAKFVKITGSLDNIWVSDNYFDIMPGSEKTIILEAKGNSLLENPCIEISAINQKNKQ